MCISLSIQRFKVICNGVRTFTNLLLNLKCLQFHDFFFHFIKNLLILEIDFAQNFKFDFKKDCKFEPNQLCNCKHNLGTYVFNPY